MHPGRKLHKTPHLHTLVFQQHHSLMSKSNTKDFQVAVIGGGVCGLACAIALQNTGVPVEIFEAAVCRSQHHSVEHLSHVGLLVCFWRGRGGHRYR